MLMPKRVKYRKPHLSRPTGKIERGHYLLLQPEGSER
jgi:hypothetical protein